MTKDEALKLAREGMEMHSPKAPEYIVCAALIEALAKPEPWEKFCDSSCVWTDHHPDCKLAQTEPVAWMFQHEETGRMMFVEAQQLELGFEKGNPRLKKIRPVYTTPQQRTWVGLTDEEIMDNWLKVMWAVGDKNKLPIPEFARAIEAKIRRRTHE